MRGWIFPILALVFFFIAAPAWSGEFKCESLPANSISRQECEANAARIQALPKRGAGVTDLGTSMGSGTDSIEVEALCGNPLAYTGKMVALRGIKMKRTIGLGSATFGGDGSCEVIVSGLPANRSFSAGNWYDLLVRPIGTTSGTNAYGATIVVPKAIYLGLP